MAGEKVFYIDGKEIPEKYGIKSIYCLSELDYKKYYDLMEKELKKGNGTTLARWDYRAINGKIPIFISDFCETYGLASVIKCFEHTGFNDFYHIEFARPADCGNPQGMHPPFFFLLCIVAVSALDRYLCVGVSPRLSLGS